MLKWNNEHRRAIKAINQTVRRLGLVNMLDMLYSGLTTPDNYYVSKEGHDGNGGTSWDDAFLTIAKAISTHNAKINWSRTPWWDYHRGRIFVAPGLYAENLTALPSQCDIIGTGIRGTDTMAEIHPATGKVMSGTALGLGLYNLWLESADDSVCYFPTMQGSHIERCVFYSGGAATYGIHTGYSTVTGKTGMKDSVVRNCEFTNGSTPFTHGIYLDATTWTADKYFHNSIIEGCIIEASTAGIYIDANCVATGGRIMHNLIYRPVKGIDDNNGNSICVGNWITASSDAIEHAALATLCLDNHNLNNATGVIEAANT